MNKEFDQDLVSIIMPAYNASSTIIESIESVCHQTYLSWELIICDDGSQDNTLELVQQFIDNTGETRIKIVENTFGKGAAGARNSSIDSANGRYIAFLDSDDAWRKSKLQAQLDFMQTEGVAFSYGDYMIFSESKSEPKGLYLTPPKVTLAELCKSCDIGCLTVMLDRQSISNVYFEHIVKEDYATWIRIFKADDIEAYRYPGVLASYRVNKNSLSGNKYRELFKQYFVLRKVAGLSVLNASLNIISYVFKGLKKHYLYYRTVGKSGIDS